MWPFKRKKVIGNTRSVSPCSYCGSTNTTVVSNITSEQPDYIKVWRGRRYVTCRCLDCGRDYYAEEPPRGLPEDSLAGEKIVSDEDELHAAEQELKRQADDESDHRYKIHEP